MTRFQEWSEFFNALVIEVASGWWTLLGLGGFVFINGVFPPLPSDSLIITLGSVQDQPGTPWWLWVILVAAGAAVLGDFVAYLLGRRIGTDRWAWLRRPAMQRTLTWSRHELDKRGVLLIFVGRFIPGARVAINFVAGSTRYSKRRFLLIDAVASLVWASWLIVLGAVGTELLGSQLLAMLVGIGVAVLLGLLCDRLFRLLSVWLDRKGVHIDPEGYQDTGVIEVERPIRLRRHHREHDDEG
ncbi:MULTISPECIES: DedA family protein [unclassified Nesterenkonia]|uniref:DedA family protein n=1 Tax=unclassified Nesterenkonia TaxID=2629769 RepID=UPI000873350E|nr:MULTISPECIES: DedA family protein [unclassified Nesterenkonia]MDS2173962.1 DedA family protein [Nesterenkonia sp. CL21]OSM44281.1 hypothetical protein BCY76_002790 [Nesterenkonia sp. PF2B19]